MIRSDARLLRLPLALCALLALAPAGAADSCESLAPEIRALLQGMARSAVAVDFSGVLTLQRGGDMQIVELSHGVREGRENAFLSRLTGQDARVRREGHPVDCVHPGHRLRLASDGAASGRFCGLADHYRFTALPGERIAGRDSVRLRAEPRDMYRFAHVFDLDRETALVLRATTLGADRRVLEQYQFASLRLHAVAAPSDDAVEHVAAHPHPSLPVHATRLPPWEPAWVPDGFIATDAAPPASARKTYTDGIATFSVFLETLPQGLQPGEGLERQGSTLAYARGRHLQGADLLITVLGEVPVNTARMVVDSVRLLAP